MASVLLYLVLFGNAILSLIYPWAGVVVTYAITLLSPQTVWWWAFQDVRPALWAIAPTLAGFGLIVLRGKVDYTMLRSRLNACVLVLYISFTLSYFFGPYVHVVNEWRFYDPDFMFSTLQKTYLTFLVGTLLIDNTRKLKFLTAAVLVTAIYMTYWANAQYLLLHKFGRIGGPTALDGSGIYADENNFAVLFVVGFPFIFYLGRYLKSKILGWGVWLVIPLSWHAIFLTASRGALLGVLSVLVMFVLRQEKRAGGIALLALFGLAFAWQAGDVMKSRSQTITGYEEEASASTRIEAWHAAANMMAAHPLTGVGFASFGQAYQDFSDKVPRIAHNTFFQIGAEWGVIAGCTYLALFFSTVNRLRKNGNRLRKLDTVADEEMKFYLFMNEACLLAMTGFFVCALFLSLQNYEVLYYLLILANATLVLSGRLADGKSPVPVTNSRSRLALRRRPASAARTRSGNALTSQRP